MSQGQQGLNQASNAAPTTPVKDTFDSIHLNISGIHGILSQLEDKLGFALGIPQPPNPEKDVTSKSGVSPLHDELLIIERSTKEAISRITTLISRIHL